MARRKIALLGSTGSIGTNTLKLIARHPDRFELTGLSGGSNIDLLAEQVLQFKPRRVCTRTKEGAQKLKKKTNLSGTEYLFGREGTEAIAADPQAHTVVSAIVGAAGLPGTLAAARAGKVVALANKESMVVAGALVKRAAKESNAVILPVDSEHNAIFQALGNARPDSVRRLILTASGGPFFQKPETDLRQVKPEAALKHPNWDMGAKITIDSATMMNKGLEIIEAYWLFDFPVEQIDVVVHPQSIVHSMVEYIDGSVLAQLGSPDMKGPIGYALAYPDRLEGAMNRLTLNQMKELTFLEPDNDRFPSIPLARKALQLGETAPAVLNGANEITVQAFLDGKILFTDIPRMNEEVLSSYNESAHDSLEDFLAADQWGRTQAEQLVKQT